MLAQAYTQALTSRCEVVVLMGHNCLYLLQVIKAELFIQGPLYRHPTGDQKGFTPLDAMRLLASAYCVSVKPPINQCLT